jgi:hypothetical protein
MKLFQAERRLGCCTFLKCVLHTAGHNNALGRRPMAGQARVCIAHPPEDQSEACLQLVMMPKLQGRRAASHCTVLVQPVDRRQSKLELSSAHTSMMHLIVASEYQYWFRSPFSTVLHHV